jgi:hypothetical protein
MKLNGATIPDAIVQRVIQRRGARFINDAIGFAAVPASRDIVPAVNRLAAMVREIGAACSGSR